MKLLIDLGNTRLKWALWDGAQLQSGGSFAHGSDAPPLDFAALWKDIETVESAWIASVAAPGLDAALLHALRARYGADPHFVHSSAQACGVRNAYAQPQRLGVDRFLGIIAA